MKSCRPEIGTYSLSSGRRLARESASFDPTDTQYQGSLAQFQDSIGVVSAANMKPPRERKNNLEQELERIEEHETVDWTSRQNLVVRSRENFFLDIPFCRTH